MRGECICTRICHVGNICDAVRTDTGCWTFVNLCEHILMETVDKKEENEDNSNRVWRTKRLRKRKIIESHNGAGPKRLSRSGTVWCNLGGDMLYRSEFWSSRMVNIWGHANG